MGLVREGVGVNVIALSGRRPGCKHFGKYIALVSNEDAQWAMKFAWAADIARNGRIYAVRAVRQADGRKVKRYMHREIWERQFGEVPPDRVIDHQEHGAVLGVDNRRTNLRLADETQNAANGRVRADNTSGFRGVSWNGRLGRWEAYITYGGERQRLGLHDEREMAAAAYDLAAMALFGPFARLNFQVRDSA